MNFMVSRADRQLQTVLIKYEFQKGFVSSIAITPLIMMDKDASKESNMENLMDEEVSARLRRAMYGSPNYRKAMEFMLRKFDEHNVLENVW